MPHPPNGNDQGGHRAPAGAHDPAHPHELVVSLLPHMYRKAAVLVPRRHEDVVHDACLKLLTHAHRLTSHPAPRAYALRCVTTVAYDHLRAAPVRVVDEMPEVPVLPIREAEATWQAQWLLHRLPLRQAQSVFLVDLCGMELAAAARVLGVHWGTVARSRDRGLNLLYSVVTAGISKNPESVS
ncbi:DNA-directed RNA polymerase specialized sigma24 family protein [Haloactinospora alba]|uniref:DNA-directed RNA polymerase specialized sigma24 family protein n=1 Tax=Haloactinospora alba TaxID=405555 RepID=A0A543NM32_9ACTN|nr:sigma-70 family RNA polymerase sigma factor [Haloactinospora alba]TQN32883.1 DNA-directed RNA polymerase specialized sigma24 family protein [Haloactinospora alba]